MRSSTRLAAVCAIVVALSFGHASWAAVVGSDEPFFEHRETTLVVTDEAGAPAQGRNVRVVYYPGADIAREISLGVTDTDGEVDWSPAYAGLARIDILGAGDSEVLASRVVGVRYERMPLPALVVFLFAVFMLCGGLVVGVMKTRRDEE